MNDPMDPTQGTKNFRQKAEKDPFDFSRGQKDINADNRTGMISAEDPEKSTVNEAAETM